MDYLYFRIGTTVVEVDKRIERENLTQEYLEREDGSTVVIFKNKYDPS